MKRFIQATMHNTLALTLIVASTILLSGQSAAGQKVVKSDRIVSEAKYVDGQPRGGLVVFYAKDGSVIKKLTMFKEEKKQVNRWFIEHNRESAGASKNGEYALQTKRIYYNYVKPEFEETAPKNIVMRDRAKQEISLYNKRGKLLWKKAFEFYPDPNAYEPEVREDQLDINYSDNGRVLVQGWFVDLAVDGKGPRQWPFFRVYDTLGNEIYKQQFKSQSQHTLYYSNDMRLFSYKYACLGKDDTTQIIDIDLGVIKNIKSGAGFYLEDNGKIVLTNSTKRIIFNNINELPIDIPAFWRGQ